MEYAIIVFKQLLVMFCYMMIGFIFFKTGLLTKSGTRSLSNILVYAVIPSIILHTFFIPYSPDVVKALGQGLLAARIGLGTAATICILVFRDDMLTRVGTTFPNAGFIGIPLITAVLGPEAIVFLMPYHILLNVFQYTYAALTLSKDKGKPLKVLATNPMIISMAIGLIVFFTGLGDKVPETVNSVINGIYGILTPMSMIILGTYLAEIDPKRLSLKKDLLASFTRLLLIPFCVFLLYKLVPLSETARMVGQIASACSIGSVIAIYAEKFDKDYIYACEVVAFTTLMLLVTMPLVMMFLV